MRYDGFGLRSAQSGPAHPSDFLFAAGWGYQEEYSDATEPGLRLMYLEQRYYDPTVGAFLSPDPIAFAGGLNLYQYSENDPVNAVDPSGLVPGMMTWDQMFAIRDEIDRQKKQEWLEERLRGMQFDAPPGPAGILGKLPSLLGEAAPALGRLGGLLRGWGARVRWPKLNGCHRGSIGFPRHVTPLPPGVGIDDLSRAAGRQAGAGGLTAAGRALQKHGNRPGSLLPKPRGSAAAISHAAQDIVDDILTDPGSTTSRRYHALYGEIVEIRRPDRLGVRYRANGEFMGFIEP
jgi:RHS repeat-associated protein